MIGMIFLWVICLVGICQMGFTWQGVDNGVAVCTAANMQYNPAIVSDGEGGSIIGWYDSRAGNYDVYIQSVDNTGTVKWSTMNGVAISTVAGNQGGPRMVSDGKGGAVLVWHDTRYGSSNYDIFAQAIDSIGSISWTLDGLAISTVAGSNQIDPRIVSDNQCGAVMTWRDMRNGNNDIYAQAIDSTGSVKWDLNGVAICTSSEAQWTQQIVSDGEGGAIIVWYDYRNSSSTTDIYAQAVDSSGVVKWATNGIAVCIASGVQLNPEIVSDGQGGAIITWDDYRNGNNDIYAQAIDSTGTVKWAANGIPICTASGPQTYPRLVSDGDAGAVIAWQNNGTDIYAQAVDSSGTVKWTLDGVAVCTTCIDGSDVLNPQIVSDGQGGAIIAWSDIRNGEEEDIYAQSINSSGTIQWTQDGVVVLSLAGYQWSPCIASDSLGGAIIVCTSDFDIYAQSIFNNGQVPIELSVFNIEE